MDESFNKSLDITDDTLRPYIPYLLQDLYALGGQPEIVRELLKRNNLFKKKNHVLDLGCGKGATLALLASEYPGQYLGIDLVPDFILEGQKRVQSLHLKGDLLLITADICREIDSGNTYDIIIYGFDSEVLGNTYESLLKIKKLLKPGGVLVFETACTREGVESQGYQNVEHTLEDISGTGLMVVDMISWEQDLLHFMNRQNNEYIRSRAEELMIKHPDSKELFEDFYQNQLKESQQLDNELQCIAFLLQ